MRKIIFAALVVFSGLQYFAVSLLADPNEREKSLAMMMMGLSETDYKLGLGIAHKDADAIKAALDAGADPNKRGLENETQLMMACQNGLDPKIIKMLLDYHASPDLQDVEGYTALIFASRGSGPETLKLLLASGADPNHRIHNDDPKGRGKAEGYTALMIACQMGRKENVKVLLAYGADATLVSADGQSAFSLAEHLNNKDILNLLEGRADPAKKEEKKSP
jgi:ankyrin repeat protein